MADLKDAIVRATLTLVESYEWRDVFIDAEVEERGKDSRPYFVDSFVAVCFCKIDGRWVDHDLDLTSEFRGLYHLLVSTSVVPITTCRLELKSDGSCNWEFGSDSPKRLSGVADTKVDAIIRARLTALNSEESDDQH